MTGQRVLVVAAHPDDEVLGAGGAIAWHRRRGDRVSILVLGEGISARYASRQEALQRAHQREFARLRREMASAHRALGVQETFHHTFPDNRFDAVDRIDLVKSVETVMAHVRPQIVYTHYLGDLNVDHRLTCEAVLTACRPLPDSPVERVLSFEVLSSTEWALPTPPGMFSPTVFVDISAVLNRKLRAMACYRSELRSSPHPRSLAAIRHQAAHRGATVGLKAAEAFVLLRERVTA